eukprot:m.307546 g.307546  ORF g.307546 m.307546 type:complete len:360 (+) comp42436_c0_seq1:67-1146(+)
MQKLRLGSAILLLFLGMVASRPEVSHIYPAWPANFSTSFYTIFNGLYSHVHVSRWNDKQGQLQFKVLSNQTTLKDIPSVTYLLLTDPPGALPGSLPSINHFVQIVLGQQCQYTGGHTLLRWLPTGLPFILGLFTPDYPLDGYCVGFRVCSDMDYVTTQLFNGTIMDVWSRIKETPYGLANLTVCSDPKTGVPAYAYTFYPGVPGSFVPPGGEQTSTPETITGNPQIDFDAMLPNNWTHTCQNLDVGVIRSDYQFHGTPNRNGSASVSLEFPCWENVTVTFYAYQVVNCSCVDCFEISPRSMTFTPESYNKPQTVSFGYKKAGCASVGMNFKGSGWEHWSGQELGTVFNCRSGSPGQPCK